MLVLISNDLELLILNKIKKSMIKIKSVGQVKHKKICRKFVPCLDKKKKKDKVYKSYVNAKDLTYTCLDNCEHEASLNEQFQKKIEFNWSISLC